MTKMLKAPPVALPPLPHSRGENVLLSSPEWPRPSLAPLFEHQSHLSKQYQNHLFKPLFQTVRCQARPANRTLRPLRDSGPRADAGPLEGADSPEPSLNPASPPPSSQDLQCLLLLKTRQNKLNYQLIMASSQNACQAVKLKKFLPNHQIKSTHLCQRRRP